MKSKYLIRLIASIISLSMIFGLVLPISAAWDGYKAPDGGTLVKVLDFDRISDIFSAGVMPSKNTIEGDNWSVRWKNIKAKPTITFKNVPRDWRNFTTIKFYVYTEKPNTGSFRLVVGTELLQKEGVTASNYFTKTNIALNHTGWKEYSYALSELGDGNASGWDKVTSVSFTANWGGTTTTEDSDICISSIYADTAEGDKPLKLDATNEGRQAVFSALGENTAIMNFSNNAIVNGKIIPVEVEDRITTDHSGRIAKFGFFTNVLGAAVDGEKSITLDGKTVDITDMVITHDDGKYLPLEKVLTELGKEVKYKDMVTIIGDAEKSDKLFDDAELLDDLKFMLSVSVLTAKDITKEDWKEIKEKWIAYLVGGKDEDPNDPDRQATIKAVEKNYENNSKSINKNKEIFALFGDKNVTSWQVVLTQAKTLKNMAAAYATYGSKYYKSPEVRRNVLYCLEWFYNNFYGIDELIDKGWKSRVGEEDWCFHIGIPWEIAETILLLGDDISMDLTKKYLYVFEASKYAGGCAAAGRTYVGTLSSILHEDYDDLCERNSDYVVQMRANNYDVHDVLTKGANEGVKEDWLYITHNIFPYSSAYGSNVLLERLATVESILSGTQFEFINPYKYDPVMWIRETFAPIIFNGAITSAQSGRFRAIDSFSETSYTWYAIAAALDLVGCFGKDDDEFLKDFIKRNVVEENKASIIMNLNGNQLSKLNKILKDETIQPEPYYRSKMYYNGDSAVHQKGDFGFAISMSSTRIAGWESILGVNMTGWYQGDGMLYTYLKDDVAQYDRQYWKYVNPYHLPGTTVDTQERATVSIVNSRDTLTSQHFVGASQFDNDYITAAMQLESYHKDNPNAVTSNKNPGGDAPNHESTLMAKKAWFLFDDEAVALGTDINADDGFEVQTVVENRKLRKTEKKKVERPASSLGLNEYQIQSAVASTASDEYPADLSYDGDKKSYWSAGGDAYIIYELEEAVPVGYIGIAQNGGDGGRQAIFEIETSVDGINWTRVWEGKASGKTIEMEAYDLKGTVAKYVKYNGHGRTNSQWNVLTEVSIFAPTKDGSMPLPKATADDTASKPEVDDSKILGAEAIVVDGTLLEKKSNYKKEFTDPKWIHIEGTGGYFLPEGGKLVMDKITNNKNFLEIWLSHGVSPKNGTYSYVVLPTKTQEETAEYSKSPDIEILSNTKELQAVREKTIGMTGLVFWEAGKFETIETSVPMIMMIKEKDAEGYYRLSITDPTHLLKEGKITLKGSYELVEADERITVSSKSGETVLTINFDLADGRSLPITLLAK